MIRGRRITSGGSGEASAALPPTRRGLGRNRRREELGWRGGEQGGSESKGGVCLFRLSFREETILTKPNNRLPKTKRQSSRQSKPRRNLGPLPFSRSRRLSGGLGTGGRFGRRRNAGMDGKGQGRTCCWYFVSYPPCLFRGRERKGGRSSQAASSGRTGVPLIACA